MRPVSRAIFPVAGLLLLAAATLPAGTSGQCEATRFGARADGRTLGTTAIQQAIDSCARRGGGVVLLTGGTFLSGTLVLKDHITLRIAPGATLLASPRIEDFVPYPAADVPKIFIGRQHPEQGQWSLPPHPCRERPRRRDRRRRGDRRQRPRLLGQRSRAHLCLAARPTDAAG